MNKRQMKKELKSLLPSMFQVGDDDNPYKSIYLGSFMSLDPCGKYHHVLSPNGMTSRCEAFWQRLDNVASELGGWIESGEGDPTDIYFCMPIE